MGSVMPAIRSLGLRWPHSGSGAEADPPSSVPAGANASANGADDLEMQAPTHGREASGRSVLSNFSLANLRQRDREAEMARQIARAELIQLARGDAQARAEDEGGAATDPGNPLPGSTPGAPTQAKKAKSRREREEAAALFGPNLASYFGSGSSSSGAVSGGRAASPPPSNGVEAGSNSLSLARRARLGSRGRARGASLSGLSVSALGFGGESITSLPSGIMPSGGSTTELAAASAAAEARGAALDAGIELDTLRRWIERSADSREDLDGSATGAGLALTTTLQSYVNLKRNTVRLVARPAGSSAHVMSPSTIASASAVDLGLLNSSSPVLDGPTSMPASPNAALRTAPSIGSMSAFVAAGGGPAPAPSHTLYFDYDCAAPSASVQVFVRASRKHGSWPARGDPLDSAEVAGTNAQTGPPHALGWPVHSARLRRGFSMPSRTALALQLALYAPPSSKDVSEAQQNGDAANVASVAEEALQGRRSSKPAGAKLDDGGRESSEREKKKIEKETLKMAVIVEALDEDGKPLSEPNLQITYLRLSSLPAKVAPPAAPTGEATGAETETNAPENTMTRSGEAARTAPQDKPFARVWSVQVEGQEAEIGPHRFQLQEVYGLSSKPPTVRPVRTSADEDAVDGADADEDEGAPPLIADISTGGSGGTECLICLSAPPSTLLLPCTHGLCLECAIQLRDTVKSTRETERRRGRVPRRKYACPVCRRAYTSMLHISTASEKEQAQAQAALAHTEPVSNIQAP